MRRSTEVNSTFCAIIIFGLMLLIGEWFVDRLVTILAEYLSAQSVIVLSENLSVNVVRGTLSRMMMSLFGVLFPVLGAAMAAGIAINLLQVGFLFTTQSLGVKFNRISPISGFKRIFSVQTIAELVKSILKITVLVIIVYFDYRNMLEEFPALIGQNVRTAFLHIMRSAFYMALKMCLVMVFVAAADFLYQWWKYEKDLRMTKQEVKDEFKSMEGDPKIKGKIRQKQRQMSAMRMMARVPEADVVITNPTHYAVALKYEEGGSSAPLVVAKGQDYIARKIKETAMMHGVQIVENKPLAQSLFELCEVDDEIPSEFYQAVADILVMVYRQKGRVR